MNTKIINLMSQPPAYGLFHNGSRPEINWDTLNGQWVGIWGLDWLDLIGKEVLKSSNEFAYEVWQPDPRADKIYSHTFSNGLVHKLFPAKQKKKYYGIKKVSDVVSQSIYENLANETKKNRVILRLGAPSSQINRDVLNLALNCPILIQYFGEFKSPLNNLFMLKKNIFGKIHDVSEHFALKKLLGKSDMITYTAESSKRNLSKYYRGEMISLCMGIDFDYWKRRADKDKVRSSLGLDNKKFILLSSSRLNSLKQVDKVINVLKKFDKHRFRYIVTGHGNEKYERYLHAVGEPLIRTGKLEFVGHVPDEHLTDLYTVADLFIMSSRSEAGPTSTLKAMAMEVPIFSTNTGQMAELLIKHDAGVVVPVKDYKLWEIRLREIFNGRKVEILNREMVKSIFHWPFVASQYIRVYKKLYDKYCAQRKLHVSAVHQENEKKFVG